MEVLYIYIPVVRKYATVRENFDDGSFRPGFHFGQDNHIPLSLKKQTVSTPCLLRMLQLCRVESTVTCNAFSTPTATLLYTCKVCACIVRCPTATFACAATLFLFTTIIQCICIHNYCHFVAF